MGDTVGTISFLQLFLRLKQPSSFFSFTFFLQRGTTVQ
ncbi:hypothetical protein CHISP_2203 [Chitinispirillum alkaliphilum]|nr:hypothetical protein CHISP_2203 [Chitinispirillum alkaliphilum]